MAKKPEPPKGADPLREDPTIITDNTPFPAPELYFKVFDSEVDEPEAKIRSDVNKLYDRWQEKYGRRWAEDGLNTEDMVWLAEEAYKPKQPKDAASGSSSSKPAPKLYEVEETEYEDEFIPSTGKEASAAAGAAPGARSGAAAAGAGKPGSKRQAGALGRQAVTNYEKTVDGGKWVTDEFESQDYEAGNLEKLWNMYLWDREGKPTMMPEGPANQQEGEESEDWDDFYTAYRPRGIDSDDAREAVWATDEFESDEDNTEDEWEPEYVGAGLGLIPEDPINPQYSLRHTNHPLAPFPGEPLKWASYVYPDFTTYEGLSRASIPHGMGVMYFGTGTGAGFTMQQTRFGDKYEGEFQAGYAHGLGQFTSETSGEVFIGEFFAGQRHGCGMTLDMKPYFYLMERGVDPTEAYQRTAEQIMRNVELRTWYRGTKLGDAGEDKVVYVNVLRDELDNPFDQAVRAELHDIRLKNWVAKTDEEKAWDRMLRIIERVEERKGKRSAGRVLYYQDAKGRVRPNTNELGNITDYDSMDMIQGVDTDGNLGLGWDGADDSSETPMEPRLVEQMVAEAMDDKAEDDAYKESVLGSQIVNPFTGLDLRTYLEGKESTHNAMVSTWMTSKEGRRWMRANGILADDEPSTYVEEDGREQRKERYHGLWRGVVSAGALDRAEAAISRWDALLAEDEPLLRQRGRYVPAKGKHPLAADDTDTAFETESDMMDMCDMAEILGTVEEAGQIVQRARMWRFKPYGEVTMRMAQDGNGAPVNLFQDPLHYPHGTKFMAPGPMGQCHPVPDDPALRSEMVAVAQQYSRIYDMYNLEWDPQPGSVEYSVDQRIRRAVELRDNALARYLEAADEAVQEGAEPQPGQGDQLLMASLEQSAGAASSSGRPAAGAGAFAAPPGSVFASMSMASPWGAPGSAAVGLGRASKAVLGALSQAARSVPLSRPRLARPSAVRAQQQRGEPRGNAAGQPQAQQRPLQQLEQQRQRRVGLFAV